MSIILFIFVLMGEKEIITWELDGKNLELVEDKFFLVFPDGNRTELQLMPDKPTKTKDGYTYTFKLGNIND